jgi:predicted DNA-binding ribbon-helix-helix protein
MVQVTDEFLASVEKQKTQFGPLLIRNVTVNGHRTSIRLEASMWKGLMEISTREGITVNDICSWVANQKAEGSSLTGAIRAFAMDYFRTAATEEGYARARHIIGTILRAEKTGNPAPPNTDKPWEGKSFAS